jgi:hypothetical protein
MSEKQGWVKTAKKHQQTFVFLDYSYEGFEKETE